MSVESGDRRQWWRRPAVWSGGLLMGLLAIGYWGAVATLVAHRNRPAVDAAPVSLVRPPPAPGPRPPMQLPRYTVPPAPAWAPFPRPRVLGLARGMPQVILVDGQPLGAKVR